MAPRPLKLVVLLPAGVDVLTIIRCPVCKGAGGTALESWPRARWFPCRYCGGDGATSYPPIRFLG